MIVRGMGKTAFLEFIPLTIIPLTIPPPVNPGLVIP
jgi:hypothetical protein